MQTQTNKSTKKAAKRRNRNKRRRKLRQQRKLHASDGKIAAPPRKIQQQQLEQEDAQNERWKALCLETFQRLTSWQSEAELNFWKARTEYLQKENKLLKEQLESVKMEAEEKHIEEQEDPAYLEFIAITHRHREELKRARACVSESVAGLD